MHQCWQKWQDFFLFTAKQYSIVGAQHIFFSFVFVYIVCIWCVWVQCTNGHQRTILGSRFLSSTFVLSSVFSFFHWVAQSEWFPPLPPISLQRGFHHKCMLSHAFHVASFWGWNSGCQACSGPSHQALPHLFIHSLVCQWTLRLIPFPGYCEQSCNNHPSTHLFHFLSKYPWMGLFSSMMIRFHISEVIPYCFSLHCTSLNSYKYYAMVYFSPHLCLM